LDDHSECVLGASLVISRLNLFALELSRHSEDLNREVVLAFVAIEDCVCCCGQDGLERLDELDLLTPYQYANVRNQRTEQTSDRPFCSADMFTNPFCSIETVSERAQLEHSVRERYQ
jgi:hypothetical protein